MIEETVERNLELLRSQQGISKSRRQATFRDTDYIGILGAYIHFLYDPKTGEIAEMGYFPSDRANNTPLKMGRFNLLLNSESKNPFCIANQEVRDMTIQAETVLLETRARYNSEDGFTLLDIEELALQAN